VILSEAKNLSEICGQSPERFVGKMRLRWYEKERASKGTIVLEAQTLKEART
jgi:hypothetical protein